MVATLPRSDFEDTLVLETAHRPEGRAPHEPLPPSPPRTRLVSIWAVLAFGVVIALVAVTVLLLPTRGSKLFGGAADRVEVAVEPTSEATLVPTQPSTPAPQPTAGPVATPTPSVPLPTVVYDDEPRGNWDVTGVAADDRLNVRTGPGVQGEILTSLGPDAAELESTGLIATVNGVLWRELIIPGDGTGWVNAHYLTETAPQPVITYGTETRGFYDVHGIAPDGVLNIRTGPGVINPVIGTFRGDTTGIASTGRTARVDGALWREVGIPGDGTGWVSAAYLVTTPVQPQAPVVTYGTEPPANWDVTGVMAGDVLNVHNSPGAGAPVIATLAADAGELESTGAIAWVDGVLWRNVVVPGDGTGWVNATYLTETAPPPEIVYGTEPIQTWDVTGIGATDVLNVRTGPGIQNPVLATLQPDAVELWSTGHNALVDGVLWRELTTPDDVVGWVNANYLAPSS